MKKFTRIILSLIVANMMVACSQQTTPNLQGNEQKEVQSIKENSLDQDTIDLSFKPIIVEDLNEGKPKEEWIKEESICLDKLFKEKEAIIHLYKDGEKEEDFQGIVYGLLEHKDKFYDLGEVGGYGLENVSIDLIDRTYDDIEEIEIIGGMGATYVQTKIIRYNEEKEVWQNLLTIANTEIADLDGDGSQELASVSFGSVPSFVSIYKWNEDHFQMVDIGEATGGIYARLYKEDTWIIESGAWEDNKGASPRYYRYDNDKLIRIDKE